MKTFIDAIVETFVDAITSDPFTMGTHVTAGLPAGRRRSPLRLTKPWAPMTSDQEQCN